MIPPSVFWLIALIVFAVGEALTVGLTSIWFAIGALGALLVSKGPVALQIVVSLLLVRPLAKKLLSPRYVRTNADRVIDKTAVVTETVDNLNGTGQVSVAGQVWTARSEHDVVLAAGRQVRILRIEGVKVFVEAL